MTNNHSRRDMLRLAVGSTALVFGLGIQPVSAANRYGILGQGAPDIHASDWIDRDGRATSFSMEEVQGRWAYLKCFQSWCPGCHQHGFPALKKVADAFDGDERFVAVGVQTVFEGFSVNTANKVREIQLQYDLPIKMGHDAGDPSGDHRPVTMRRYRTGGTPWVVIIDPSGQVVFNDYHIDAERFISFLEEQLARS